MICHFCQREATGKCVKLWPWLLSRPRQALLSSMFQCRFFRGIPRRTARRQGLLAMPAQARNADDLSGRRRPAGVLPLPGPGFQSVPELSQPLLPGSRRQGGLVRTVYQGGQGGQLGHVRHCCAVAGLSLAFFLLSQSGYFTG